MARRNYQAIDAELLMRLANRTDLTSDMRANFIRDAYLNVAMLFRHREIELTGVETLALGADTLTPVNSTDLWFPTAIRNVTDGFFLTSDQLERVEVARTKPTAPPYKYYWYGGVFRFDSFANTAKSFKLWYKRKPIPFTNLETSELDELFDPFIIMDAARIGFETVRDYEEAKIQLALFNAEIVNKKIPVNQAKLNDYRQGFKVKFK